MLNLVLILLACFASSVYAFQMYFMGSQIGDPWDTRMMINQHEHWFRFFTGKTELRDTFTFYPFDKALGLTDAFLVSGLFHSILRTLNISIVDAWSIATFLFFLFGNVGWIFVARRLLTKKVSQFGFVLTSASTPTLVILLERSPQIAGYTWLSWLLYFTIVGIDQNKLNKVSHGFGLVLIVLPLLMLSSWYPAFFYVITAAACFSVYAFQNLKKISNPHDLFKRQIMIFKTLKFYLFGSVLLLSLWAYIHIPVASKTLRSWEETLSNSNYFSQIINQKYMNNGWYFIFIKKFEYEPFQKSNLAVPILILTLVLIFSIFSFFSKDKKIQNYRTYLLVPTFLITVIFTQISENFSIFRLFWDYIPGFYSIRYPYRYLIIFSFVALIFIFIYLDHLQQNPNKSLKQTLSYLISLFLIIDLYKPPLSLWKKEDFLPKELLAQEKIIRENCDFFILDRPGGWWDDQITATSLAALINVPTSNGSSGGYPEGYPAKNWFYEGDISEILEWSSFGLNLEEGCLISDSHPPIFSNPKESKILFHSGFSPQEEDQKGNYWRWGDLPAGYAILSVPQMIKKVEINMNIKAADCLEKTNLIIYKEPNQILYQDVITPKGKNINFFVENNSSTITQLKFELENQYCQFEGDPRNLYFEVKNYEIRLSD